MRNKVFSFARLWAMIIKEFIQMKRDRATLALIIGIPFLQVALFGFAINSDPKHLPTAVLASDNSPFVRSFVTGMQNSGYFNIVREITSEQEANLQLAEGKILFILNVPPNFSRDFVRGDTPSLLLEADGTDPAATSNAVAAANILTQSIFQPDIQGQLSYLQPPPPKVNLIVQPKYNPAGITQYNIVTGLLGVVLTMTMTMVTSIAITRERDRGTMENLLATPLSPLEIIVGKILPYVIVGYIQVTLIIILAKILFSIPIAGNIILLYLLSLPFIAANLAIGITISTIAKTPLQAVQMAVFFFLPSILLSGFMFPFRGMPIWAQYLGNVLPLTHYVRIVRGILIKGNGMMMMWNELVPILLFLCVVVMIGLQRFQRTLD